MNADIVGSIGIQRRFRFPISAARLVYNRIRGGRVSTGYQEVIAKIQTLSSAEQAQLLEYLSSCLGGEQTPTPKRSLLELEGLGRGTWAGIDAQEYVRQERDSWDG
jgi:hypothetical protein